MKKKTSLGFVQLVGWWGYPTNRSGLTKGERLGAVYFAEFNSTFNRYRVIRRTSLTEKLPEEGTECAGLLCSISRYHVVSLRAGETT